MCSPCLLSQPSQHEARQIQTRGHENQPHFAGCVHDMALLCCQLSPKKVRNELLVSSCLVSSCSSDHHCACKVRSKHESKRGKSRTMKQASTELSHMSLSPISEPRTSNQSSLPTNTLRLWRRLLHQKADPVHFLGRSTGCRKDGPAQPAARRMS